MIDRQLNTFHKPCICWIDRSHWDETAKATFLHQADRFIRTDAYAQSTGNAGSFVNLRGLVRVLFAPQQPQAALLL